MKAVILAAGQGRRLQPLTAPLPKPMIEVAGKPVLEHNVALLARHGITDIAINLYHKPEVIQSYFQDGERFGVHIRYSLEDDLLGTAGALVPLEEWLDHEAFVVCYGDTYSTCDLSRMLAQHKETEAMVTLAVVKHETVSSYGVVRLGSHDQVVGFIEKPRTYELHNAGMMACEASILALLPRRVDSRYAHEVCDFGKEILPKLIGNGAPVYAYRMRGDERIVTIDTQDKLEQARLILPIEADYEAMLRGGTD